jgi:RNA polymerase sigma-70 factor, ECF subfamily
VKAGAAAGPTRAERFEAFVRTYQDMVFATAVRLLGAPADAEDIAQTVFLRAFERFDEIGSSPSAGGWLKTVTRNACLNHLSRYRGRMRLFSELERPDGEPIEDAAWFAHMSRSAGAAVKDAEDDAERVEAVEHALRGLPDHQRVPLVLFHFEGLSYQEIADALGISLGKAKTDIHRGREALRQVLAPNHAS